MKVSRHRQNYKDLTGQTINNLLFVKDAGERTSGGNVLWTVKCYCGKIFLTRANRIVHGHTTSCGCYRSKVCSERASARVGPLHPHWNGGLSDIERLKNRNKVDKWRALVYKRDNYTCQCCNKKSTGKINAHHLDGYAWCEEGRYDIDNGITLCIVCHKAFHKQYGIGKNTKQQFEEFLKEREE